MTNREALQHLTADDRARYQRSFNTIADNYSGKDLTAKLSDLLDQFVRIGKDNHARASMPPVIDFYPGVSGPPTGDEPTPEPTIIERAWKGTNVTFSTPRGNWATA